MSMVPPAGSTDQLTAVDCPGAIPVTVAWKATAPPIVVETTDGLELVRTKWIDMSNANAKVVVNG